MAIFSTLAGMIGQGGAQQGGDMAWGAANQANQQNQAEAARSRQALAPWYSAGTGALNKVVNLLGLGSIKPDGTGGQGLDPANAKEYQDQALADFETSPGYTWRKQEGINALDRSASSRGSVRSGAQIKAVQGFGDGLASEEYGNYFNRLMGVNEGGMGAATSGNNTAAGLTASGGNYLAQGGMARGSGYAAGANALASGISSGVQNTIGAAYLGKKAGWF